MKAKYRPVHHRAPNTTSTFVEPARQTTAWPGSSDFAQQLESKKQHLHHVPAAMMHDASVPFIEKQAAQGYQQQGYQQQGYQQQGYQQQGFQQQGYQQGYKDTGLKQEGLGNVAYTEAPVLYKSEQRPAVLKERILPIEEENIQPVVHRQIERREVHEVIQPIHEKQYLAPVIEEKQLPAESRQFGTYQPRVHTQLADTREYAATEHFKKTNAPIIEETIRKTIVEEVQPVVHRETVAPHIIKETLPIYERVIEPEVVLKETRPMMECCEPATFEKQVAVPSAPALPAQTFQEKTWTAQPLAQETKYVFEIQQKTKLIPQGTIPAEQTYSAPRYK